MDSIQLKKIRIFLLRIAFIAWVIIWAFFVVREMFIKGNISDYMALSGKSLEAKREYITGEDLYGLITLAKNSLPDDATYRFEGLEDGSLEKRRAVYYLYPYLEDKDADYILVYDTEKMSMPGHEVAGRLDDKNYILGRIGE